MSQGKTLIDAALKICLTDTELARRIGTSKAALSEAIAADLTIRYIVLSRRRKLQRSASSDAAFLTKMLPPVLAVLRRAMSPGVHSMRSVPGTG